MLIHPNKCRAALLSGQTQIGLWAGLADANVAESLAGCGFDWLLIDAEHEPNDPRSVLDQLRDITPYPVYAVIRPVRGDVALIKHYSDIGTQTLLVPMIDTPEQALEMGQATRYPPDVMRGVGAALARASRWNQIENYLNGANDEMCLLVQAETPTSIQNLVEIASIKGVDGVFFGPADLSASMGYRGRPGHPEVQSTILEGIRTVRDAGKAAGVLTSDQTLAQSYLNEGATFVAVDVDATLLVRAATDLATKYKGYQVTDHLAPLVDQTY